MKVFVAGGTGFVGRYVVRKLMEEGACVRLLVREGSEGKVPRGMGDGLEVFLGSPYDRDVVVDGVRGCDAVVNLVGIIRAFPARGITFEKVNFDTVLNLAYAARRNKVNRFVQMSALGVDWDERVEYFWTKWKADQYLMDHDFEYTIFRPSVIFGDGDGFVGTIERLVKFSPVVPIPGDGSYRLQPVYVEDVAAAFASAVLSGKGVRRVYTVTGPEVITFERAVYLVARHMRKKRLVLRIPMKLMMGIASRLERFSFFPVTYDQLYMLSRGSVGDNKSFLKDFGIEPTRLEDYLRKRFGAA